MKIKFRFGLRAMLVAMFFCCTLLGLVTRNIALRRNAVKSIISSGGSTYPLETGFMQEIRPSRVILRDSPKLEQDILHDITCLKEVRYLEVPWGGDNPIDLRPMDKFSALRPVSIDRADDSVFDAIRPSRNIKSVELTGKSLCGNGISALARLPNLHVLNLSHTNFDDDAAKELTALNGVK